MEKEMGRRKRTVLKAAKNNLKISIRRTSVLV